jgi:hypothetical protein
MSNEVELSADERDAYQWLTKGMLPSNCLSHEDAIKCILRQRTKLWDKLNRENFAETGSDYGYGGEIVDTVETNHEALYEWIVERERKILGMTLEEFSTKDWKEFSPNPETSIS